MSETINILDTKAANIVIFSAMVEHCKNDDILEVFNIIHEGGNSKAEVKVLVNNVEVPFSKCLVEAMESLMENYDKHLEEKAKKLLSQTKLSGLMYALEQAEDLVGEEFNKLDISL